MDSVSGWVHFLLILNFRNCIDICECTCTTKYTCAMTFHTCPQNANGFGVMNAVAEVTFELTNESTSELEIILHNTMLYTIQ